MARDITRAKAKTALSYVRFRPSDQGSLLVSIQEGITELRRELLH